MAESSDTGGSAGDGGASPDGGDGAPDSAGRQRVLDALEPLIEQMDHYRGFTVKYATRPSADDPDMVEVRFRYPKRDPREVKQARGMLSGNDLDHEKRLRGGQADTYASLMVRVGEGPEDDGPPSPGEGGEQASL